MTTKNLKIFDEANREYFKLKKEEMEKGFADKQKRKEEAQAHEDSGLARAIISKSVREPRVSAVEVAPVAEPKKAKKVKFSGLNEKKEEVAEVLQVAEPVDSEKEALKKELEALKAKLAEKEAE